MNLTFFHPVNHYQSLGYSVADCLPALSFRSENGALIIPTDEEFAKTLQDLNQDTSISHKENKDSKDTEDNDTEEKEDHTESEEIASPVFLVPNNDSLYVSVLVAEDGMYSSALLRFSSDTKKVLQNIGIISKQDVPTNNVFQRLRVLKCELCAFVLGKLCRVVVFQELLPDTEVEGCCEDEVR